MAITSDWGYATTTLSDTSPYLQSDWGYTTTAIFDPGTVTESSWGYAVAKLQTPHQPVRIKTASGWKYKSLTTIS